MDSFAAFEEVLYLAKRYQADMVLLAGDLFHENRPSRRTLYKTMEILRRYCLGSNPVRLQCLSDPAQSNFAAPHLNYQDAHYAVDLPLFSIHGNHDDPTRDGGDLLAALDLLSMANLVNYFGTCGSWTIDSSVASRCQMDTHSHPFHASPGRQNQVDDIQLYPALLQKGTTRMALYGLGSMRDERLNRMWREGKVQFFRYGADEQDDDDNDNDDSGDDGNSHMPVFNVLALHQNRDTGRGNKNCVQETLIPDFCDLVVWGHEHECQIEFAESLVGTFRITQPGSSVATSLVAGEAVRKKVGVLDIKGKQFRMHAVPLTQVRTFCMGEVNLQEDRANLDPTDSKIDQKVTRILEEQVQSIIMDAQDDRKKIIEEARKQGSNAGDEDSPLMYKLLNPEKVLVRLRVEHTGFQTLNTQRFGAKFVDEIANSENILLFHRKKAVKVAESKATRKAREAMARPMDPDELERTNVEDLVRNILELPESKLTLLSEKGLGEAMEEYVEKNNLESIPHSLGNQLTKRQKVLISNKELSGKSDEVREMVESESQLASAKAKEKGRRRSKDDSAAPQEPSSASDDDDPPPKVKSKSNATSSSRMAPPPARRRKAKPLPVDSDDDDAMVVDAPPPKSKSRARRKTSTVNYSLDNEDAADGMDFDDEQDDAPANSRRQAPTSAARKLPPGAKKKKPASARKRPKKFMVDSDDEEDDAAGGSASIGLDADWGSAATRSQF
jgi:double-strand break repair protein MRE11